MSGTGASGSGTAAHRAGGDHPAEPDRVESLLRALTREEKAALTAGLDMWSTTPVERVGIPSFGMTDGPSGARGRTLDMPTPSTAVPCGTALGATWDPELLAEVGAVIGSEARRKGCRVLLAPTVNLHRSPLAGRTFECFSEDPLLAGRLAAGFVRGAQSTGVVCTVKHFAGNEAEFERYTMDSVIDERALRELYLVPFEIAVREGGALGIMTAYNRLNGTWCSEHASLLTGILRDEWGFDGFVVTDWYATTDTVGSPAAGVDLEMPGPARRLGARLAEAVRSGQLDESVVDAQVRHLLGAFARIGALDDPPQPEEREADEDPQHRIVARRAAVGSMVLLRNDGVLPFDASSIRTLAVIGPNADRAQVLGGGSSTVAPHHRTTPLDALRRQFGDRVAIVHEPGCDIDRILPPLAVPMDVAIEVDGRQVAQQEASESQLLFFGPPAPGATGPWTARADGTFVPEVDGRYQIGLTQAGRARVFVGGELVIDGLTSPPPPGTALFGFGSEQVVVERDLRAGRPTEIVIELTPEGAPALVAALVGVRPAPPVDLLDRAVAAAAGADATVLVVGTNGDWETETHDRSSLHLPGEQDELVLRVVAANPRTAVVVNAGSPVALPWADDAPAVLDVWFGGQEMADALVDVLFGHEDPGGRLPLSFPERIEHTAAFGNFPGENGEVRYGESLLMGYRWHEARYVPARFPLGHGLSYTEFEIGAPKVLGDDGLLVRTRVTNSGSRAGTEVVQLYVEPVAPETFRPVKELKAFAKVALGPGESTVVELELDDRAFSCWRPEGSEYAAVRARAAEDAPFLAASARVSEATGWDVASGEYRLHLGRSSSDIAHVVSVWR
jgi:beta-glucosidase